MIAQKKRRVRRTERAHFRSNALEVETKAGAELARRRRVALLAAGIAEQRQLAVEVVLVRQVQAIDGELPLGRRNVPGDPSIEHAISRLSPVLLVPDSRDG